MLAAHPPPRPACDPRCAHPPSPCAAEIIAFDNVVVVYKFVGDLYFYATADAEENEVILAQVLTTFVETISLLLTCVTRPPAARLRDGPGSARACASDTAVGLSCRPCGEALS